MVTKNTTKPAQETKQNPSLATLAEHISAVLSHPQVPSVVYDHLSDGLLELNDTMETYHSPPYILAILTVKARQKGRR